MSGKEAKDCTWEHCEDIIKDGKKRLRCNYCGKDYAGGIYRMKNHLAKTKRDIEICTSVPDDVCAKFKMILNDKIVAKVSKRREQDGASFDDGDDGEDCQIVGNKRKSTEDGGSSKKQNTLNAMWKPTDREKCCKKICRFIYALALPFNIVKSIWFKKMIEEVSMFGKGLKSPSYHEVRNTFLKMEVAAVNLKLEKYKKEWKKTGCSIMSDGWTDGKGRSIINFLVNSPAGTVFLKSVDASSFTHDGEYIMELLDSVVVEVGEENVMQVVTDCAPNYVKAGKLLEEKRKHLFWTPCGAHILDLTLEDIGEMDLPKKIVAKAKKITIYIYKHTWVLSLMRKHTGNRELARPAITRFATNYLTLQSIMDNRQPLRSMFASKEWEESSFAKEAEAVEVTNIILGDREFWAGVKYTINITAPLVRVLRLCDSDDRPSMGYIYEAMDQAKEKIAKNVGVLRRYKKVWEIIDDRWNAQLHRPLHAAAYFLNPRFHFSDNFEANEEVMNGYYDVIERMIPKRSERTKIDIQLDKFKTSEGAFGRESAVDARTSKQPALWWESFGNHCPELQRVAIRILSLVSSSTGCERNWSTFEQIHTKRRNKLEQKRMNALVFVKYNLALEQRQSHREQGTDPICLDELEDDNEWIVEKEVPILHEVPVVPEETTWLDIIDCFVENEGETSRKRRPRNLNKPLPSAKGKNVVIEDDDGDDDMEDDNDDMDDVDMAAIERDI